MTSITNLKSQWEQQARDDERNLAASAISELAKFAAEKQFNSVSKEKLCEILYKISDDLKANLHRKINLHRKASTNEV